MGLCLGKFLVAVDNASSGGWRVGLSRPQMEYVRDTTKPAGRVGQISYRELVILKVDLMEIPLCLLITE